MMELTLDELPGGDASPRRTIARKLRGDGRAPSAKQGGILLADAARVGFRHDGLLPRTLATMADTLASLG